MNDKNIYNDPNFPGKHQGSNVMQLEPSTQSWVSTERRFKFQQPLPDLPPVDPDLVTQFTLRGKIEDLKEYIHLYPEVVDMKDKRNGNVAIHIASSRGNMAILNFLLSKGANFNIQDMFGRFSS
jgi:hypothetical protein